MPKINTLRNLMSTFINKTTMLLIALICTAALYGQTKKELPYKPLTEFGTDTTAFVMYNFRDRGDCYKDKTVSDVLADLQIPVKTYLMSVDENDSSKLIGLVFFVYDKNEVGRLNYYQLETNGIRIYLTEPMDAKKLLDFADKSGKNEWSKKIMNVFRNKKISRTRSLIYYYSPYRQKYKDQLD